MHHRRPIKSWVCMVKQKINKTGEGAIQLGMFMPNNDWKPTPVSELPTDWNKYGRIGLDAETKDSLLTKLGPGTRRGGYVVGWSIAFEGGPKYYLPFRHDMGGNLDPTQVRKYMKDNFATYKGEVVGANLSYDLDYANAEGITFPEVSHFRDVQIADPLIYELHHSFSLLNIGRRYGIEAKDETVLREAALSLGIHPKGGLWRMHSKYVGAYAENDASSPLEIYAKQRETLTKEDLWEVFNLESKVIPVLDRMRRRGVRIHLDRLTKIEQWALAQETEALAFIKRETGHSIEVGDVWAADVLQKPLKQIGMTIGKTATGKPQINAELLESSDHPVLKSLRWARKTNKMRTTFAASMRRYMIIGPDGEGRIHCSFNQIAREDEKGDQKGARYGRTSCVDPNLQQQYNPEKEPELSAEWRKIFLPERDALWGCNDYSQQEPRWTTHFAAYMKLRGAGEAARRYREDPKTDSHTMMTKLVYGDERVITLQKEDYKKFKELRGYAKALFLGLCYGEGGAKLCSDIGLPTRYVSVSGRGSSYRRQYFETKDEAMVCDMDNNGYSYPTAGVEGQEIIDGFNRAVPFVSELAKKAKAQANKYGYVKTILGRKLHFPKRDDGKYDWTHKALNRVIQGSSADQTKQAMIDLDAAGYFLQLQVHDETDGSYGSVAEALQAGKIMSECVNERVKPLVPFNVDTEVGESWGELKEAA